MITFRYVLVLERGDRHRVLRHSSFQPLRVGQLVRTADHGAWTVSRIVESDDATFRDGVAHCQQADLAGDDDEQR